MEFLMTETVTEAMTQLDGEGRLTIGLHKHSVKLHGMVGGLQNDATPNYTALVRHRRGARKQGGGREGGGTVNCADIWLGLSPCNEYARHFLNRIKFAIVRLLMTAHDTLEPSPPPRPLPTLWPGVPNW